MNPLIEKWIKGEDQDLTPEQRRLIPLVITGEATEKELEVVGDFAFDVKLAELPRARVLTGAFVQADDDSRTLTWVLSDERVDRAGDIIRQNGWDLTNYKRNPVVMWGHAMGFDSDADEPIGRGTNLRVETVKGKPALVGDLQFPDESVSERAARKYRLAKAGFISAGSVGFMPKSVRRVDDEKERNEIGLGRFGVVFEKQELIEFSLCAIPYNPGALQLALDNGTIKPEDAESIGPPASERELAKWARTRARSFVTVTTPAEEPTPVDQFTAAQSALAKAVADIGTALRELSAGQKAQAQALSDLAGSIRSGKAAVASGQGLRAQEVLDAINRTFRKGK